MRNYSYRATSSDWTKIYDASVTGDFNGFIQSVNGFQASIIISATTPTPSDVGVLIDDDPTNITIRASDSENLYARIPNNGNASMLSMLTDADGATEQDSAVFTASVSSASVLFTVDMTNWRSVLLQITSAGSSCTVAYECSNDQGTWYPLMGISTNYNTASALGTVTASLTTTGVQMQFPKRAKYFRARVSVYGSGTVSVAYALSLSDCPTPAAAAVWGPSSEGAAVGANNPVTIGLEARTSNKTSVGNGQVVRPIGTVDGKMIIRPHSIPENEWSYAAASGGIVNTTSPVTLAAAVASVSIYVTSIQLRAQALTNATEIALRDGSGTVYWRSEIGTSGMPLTHIKFENPLKLPVNSSLSFLTSTASGTGAVYISAQGYRAP